MVPSDSTQVKICLIRICNQTSIGTHALQHRGFAGDCSYTNTKTDFLCEGELLPLWQIPVFMSAGVLCNVHVLLRPIRCALYCLFYIYEHSEGSKFLVTKLVAIGHEFSHTLLAFANCQMISLYCVWHYTCAGDDFIFIW